MLAYQMILRHADFLRHSRVGFQRRTCRCYISFSHEQVHVLPDYDICQMSIASPKRHE